ncbi:MAG: efflux RND transporter permease subunit [Bacteroidales bacterium]|jgi:multidrug efflux pump subunit AcrB
MKISELAVKNHQFTIVVFVMLIVVGVYAYLKIPQAEDPDLPMPIVPVTILYPGASPVDMEELVVDKIEKSIKELDNVKRTWSEMKDGVATVVVEFTADSDPDKKYDEVVRQVQNVRPTLPQDLYLIDLKKINAGETNIIQGAIVSGTSSYDELRIQAEKLKDIIATIPGVKKADAVAYPAKELRVAVDLPKLSQLRITVSQLMNAIQSENANIPGGSVEIGPQKFNIKTSGNYQSLAEVDRTIVGSNMGQVVYLKDVATVNWDDEDLRYYGRYNGTRAVFITASMMEGQNIHDVRNLIYDQFDTFQKQLPASMKFENGFDQSHNVKKKLSGLQRDFLFAILLVLLTLLPLGLRASGVVMVAIPLSVLIGLSGLYFLGYSINQLSIVGAVIALGLLVDDSIVVVENISRWIREGAKPVDAAIKGTKQIGAAVLGCTATLLFAFLPLMFLPGMPGKYIRILPVTISLIVLSSLFVALTIIPFITSKIFKGNVDPRGNMILRGLNKVIDFTYGRALHWSLRNPVSTLLIALVFFGSSLLLINIIGFSLFPKAGMQQFLITIETPKGNTLAETDKAVQFVESMVGKKKEINYYMSNIGRGNPKIFYNVFQKAEQTNLGEMLCEMNLENQDEMTLFLDQLRDTLNSYVNARIFVTEFENGSVIGAPIALRLVGDDLALLKEYSVKIDSLMKSTPGTTYGKNPLSETMTDIRVAVNSDKAGLLGIPGIEIDRTVRLGLAGLEVGKYREANGKEYAIKVRLPKDSANTLATLDKIYVSSLSGAQIPLSQLARIEFVSSPTLIEHFNQERYNLISSYVKTGYNTDRVTKEILSKIDAIRLPEGFKIIPSGEIEGRQESFGGVGIAILVAIFGIFSILILEFRTFKSTLIVLSVIPLGIMGGIVALYLTGFTLSFAAAVGFVALIGIEIKNSILLVDFTNQLRQQGVELNEAIIKAGEIRFLPVILTTMTAIGGLLPIALGDSNLYSPLAWVIIGGLVTSTLLARLVTPVMYKLLPPEIVRREA